MVSAVGGDTADGGKRNVCNEQYTERASLEIVFLINTLVEIQDLNPIGSRVAGV
jgi:hypothetical protein